MCEDDACQRENQLKRRINRPTHVDSLTKSKIKLSLHLFTQYKALEP